MTATTIDSSGKDHAAPYGLSAYQLRLPTFEGPLDVLLRLIERNQLPIAEVSLVEVTDQFLEYIQELESAPAVVIAEFAAVGARLTLLKSRALLPQPPEVTEESDPDDLVHQLLEYRALRTVAQILAERAACDVTMYVRPPSRDQLGENLAESRLATYPPHVLARSLRRRLSLLPKRTAVLELRPAVSLREMIQFMNERLRQTKRLLFSSIIAECRDRREVQTAFLALLVLVRRRHVDARQEELFGEIALVPTLSRGELVQGLGEDTALGLAVRDEPFNAV
jgi:segregation and condensation protein A